MSRADRLDVGIVGAGKVGSVLGLALAGAGHSIVAMSAVSDASVERATTLLPNVPILPVHEIVERAQLVIFAIPGAELPAVVEGLTTLKAWQPGQIALHTSAEHGFGVFTPALAAGVIPIAFHPAMVFTGTSLDLASLKESTVAVTAPAPVLPIAQALAVEVGAEPIVIAEADRAAYADTVDALGQLAGAIVRQSLEALSAIGVEEPSRTVSSIARAAVDAALLEVPGRLD